MKTLKLVLESFRFALNALKVNRLRTLLSLGGVAVGIFSIIGVLTMVDSLERNMRESLSFLGENTIYVAQFPWEFDNENYPWWKYFQRPHPDVDEYRYMKERMGVNAAVTIFDSRSVTIKYRNNSSEGVALTGGSDGYEEVFELPIEEGRYFSPVELSSARPVVIIGQEIKDNLFAGIENVIGQNIKIKGLRFTVIGLLEKQGTNLLGTPSNDEKAIIPYGAYAKLFQSSGRGASATLAVKSRVEEIPIEEVEAEVRGHLRASRGLRPKEEDNFALNRPEFLSSFLDVIFQSLTIAGMVIGGFATLVGGFGIANIMFVSVRERTPIIGIQKSLGAKNYFILLQFLFEAILLSLIGALVGSLLVYLISFVQIGTFVITMSLGNLITGLLIAISIGVISGMVPAVMASNMNPVTAIRFK
ncbi:ABC transporter permease [Roseivirga sp. BDSF3-8]|uniref:ABC transporter permease n=1 Tax=Roseivirga sp. BDSF3-8 TaxID=3241598 RepID=UPI003532257C